MPCLQGAGIAIRPHLSDLVCCMLEGLSSLEDQGLNYVEVWSNIMCQSKLITLCTSKMCTDGGPLCLR